ncbi:MAG: hypothetical protein K5873_07735 [Treponema sp.]|nr:hypothetical protein [Treponema sp.]
MKKLTLSALLTASLFLFYSCASTSTLPQELPAQNEELAQEEGNNQSELFPSEEKAAELPQESSNPAENLESSEENSEKVDDSEANLNKERDQAPTPDEKSKVAEYPIMDEPEVRVLDLPQEEEKSEILTEEIVEEEGELPNKIEEVPSVKEELPQAQEITEAPQIPEIKKENTAEKNNDTSLSENKERTAIDSENPEENTSEEIQPAEEGEESAREEDAPIIPSRKVVLNNNQYLDVVYPGSGWVYIGETEKTPLFNYFGRRLGSENTNFALRAKKSGKTILHFYKNDGLTGEYIDDYLEVEVLNKKSAGRVKAPSYADIVPAKPQRRIDRTNLMSTPQSERQNGEVQADNTQNQKEKMPLTEEKSEKSGLFLSQEENGPSSEEKNNNPENSTFSEGEKAADDVKTVIQTAENSRAKGENPQINENIPTSSESLQEEEEVILEREDDVIIEEYSEIDESLLEKAKKDFEEKNYEKALNEAQTYLNNANSRLDEALYLLGQIWESDSQVKNIRSALDSYNLLVKQYPKSSLWQKAKNRSVYLKRFYIDIR